MSTNQKYQLFTRSWWDAQGNPKIGRRTNVRIVYGLESARAACSSFNSNTTKAQDKRGYKMEFTSI